MSIRLMSQVWDNADPELSGSRLVIMLCLADHANDTGECWPSIDRLAERSRIHRTGVIAHLHELEEMGYIKVGRSTGRHNTYLVLPTRSASTTSITTPTGSKTTTTTRSASTTTTRSASTTTPVAPALPEPSINHQRPNHQENHQEADLPPAPPPAPKKAKEVLSVQAQTYLDNGGSFPTGTLTDGTTKRARAIQFITEHVTDDPVSLNLWGRVVAGYAMQWSAKSYTVMVNDYYLAGRVPGEPQKEHRSNGNGNPKPGYGLASLPKGKAAREPTDAERAEHAAWRAEQAALHGSR